MTSSNRIRQPQTYVLNGVEQSGVLAVPLQKGQFMLIDECDWPLLSYCNWSAMAQSHTAYAISADGKRTLAHRLIMGSEKGQLVDHVNGNGLDNRRSNLRPANGSQNNCNSKTKRANANGFKGVVHDPRTGAYYARIGLNRSKVHLGTFPSPIEAAKAYDKAAQFYHGEFARLNFPTTYMEAK